MGCMRKRIKLIDRRLPDYSKGEEIMNMVTHITGGALGIAALVLCVVRAALRGGAVDVVGADTHSSVTSPFSVRGAKADSGAAP